jgi:hypothetical protein
VNEWWYEATLRPSPERGPAAGTRRELLAGRDTARARPGRLSALRVSRSKSFLYGAFVWARRPFNRHQWRFLARAVRAAARGGGAARAPGEKDVTLAFKTTIQPPYSLPRAY